MKFSHGRGAACKIVVLSEERTVYVSKSSVLTMRMRNRGNDMRLK